MELENLKYKIMSEQLSTEIKLTEKQNIAYNLMANGKNEIGRASCRERV